MKLLSKLKKNICAQKEVNALLFIKESSLAINIDTVLKVSEVLLRYKNFSEADSLLNDAFKFQPANIEINLIKLKLHLLEGKYQKANELANNLILNYPNNFIGYCKKAEVARVAGDIDKAKQLILEALDKVVSNDVPGWLVNELIKVYGIIFANKVLKSTPHNVNNKTPDTTQKFLFVSGLPRSGTSALGKFLNLSEDIGIYQELLSPLYPYSPSSFDKEFVSQELNGHPHEQFNRNILIKNSVARYIGDKRPMFYYRMKHTLDLLKFHDVRIWHVVRPIHHVCLSYQRRASNPEDKSWDIGMDYKAAVYEYNLMMRFFNEFDYDSLLEKHHIRFISYNKIFSNLNYALDELAPLHLHDFDNMQQKVRAFQSQSAKVLEKNRVPPAEISNFIKDNIDFNSLKKFQMLTGIDNLMPIN
jgi:tetratricopeptide (TPR) repeat protein